MSNRDFPRSTPLQDPHREEARRTETLRPTAQDPVAIDDRAYIKPVRWPLLIAVTGLTLAGFVGVIAAAAHHSGLAGVNATLAAAEQRNATERANEGGASLVATATDTAAVERAV